MFDPKFVNIIVLISALSLSTIVFTHAQSPETYPPIADPGPNKSRETYPPIADPGPNKSPETYPPIADPGPDKEVREGKSIIVDGSGSSDKDGQIKSYSWNDENADVSCLEAGHLSSYHEAKVKFLASQVTKDCSIYFELTVTDYDNLRSTKGVLITVRDVPTSSQPRNAAPIANAGEDQNVKSGEIFRLDGSKSKDPDCDSPSNPNCGKLKYNWERIDDDKAIRGLEGSSKVKPKFTAPSVDSTTVLKFSLIVNDYINDSAPSTVNIAIDPIIKSVHRTQNSPPIADAGSDQVSDINSVQKISLDGTGSHDPDTGDKIVAYSWSQTSGPPVTLLGMDTITPKFVVMPSTYGSPYEFRLVVTDTKGQDSDPSNVKIIVNSVPKIGTDPASGGMTISNLLKSLPFTPSETLILIIVIGGMIGGIIALKSRHKAKSSKCVIVDVDVSGGLKE